MPAHWMPGYENSLAGNRPLDAFVEFTLADAPPPVNRIPPWLMKQLMRLLLVLRPQYRQMLDLLPQNLREWREIVRLDGSYENYREISAGVLFMYGGNSRSRAVTLCVERLTAIIPHAEAWESPKLDHFGIERTAPAEVARVAADYFLKG